jgi:putative hydrolase of the HAD superfamily
MIKAVLFDLGGVVVDFSNEKHYAYLSRISGKPVHKIRKMIEDKELVMLEKDTTDIRSFERYVAKKLEIQVKRVEWYEVYKRSARINLDVEGLLERLHNEYITGFISNIDKTRYVYTRKILNLDAFDYRFASCFIGYRKPDPRIYRFALKKISIKPEEAVFIDNMLENVVSARKIGIKAVHFINRRLLDRELAKLGI